MSRLALPSLDITLRVSWTTCPAVSAVVADRVGADQFLADADLDGAGDDGDLHLATPELVADPAVRADGGGRGCSGLVRMTEAAACAGPFSGGAGAQGGGGG